MCHSMEKWIFRGKKSAPIVTHGEGFLIFNENLDVKLYFVCSVNGSDRDELV